MGEAAGGGAPGGGPGRLAAVVGAAVLVAGGVLLALQRPADPAARTAMVETLTRLRAEQAAFRSANGAYAGELDRLDHRPVFPATVELVEAGEDGWSARARHPASADECAISVGDAGGLGPVTRRGIVQCGPASRRGEPAGGGRRAAAPDRGGAGSGPEPDGAGGAEEVAEGPGGPVPDGGTGRSPRREAGPAARELVLGRGDTFDGPRLWRQSEDEDCAYAYTRSRPRRGAAERAAYEVRSKRPDRLCFVWLDADRIGPLGDGYRVSADLLGAVDEGFGFNFGNGFGLLFGVRGADAFCSAELTRGSYEDGFRIVRWGATSEVSLIRGRMDDLEIEEGGAPLWGSRLEVRVRGDRVQLRLALRDGDHRVLAEVRAPECTRGGVGLMTREYGKIHVGRFRVEADAPVPRVLAEARPGRTDDLDPAASSECRRSWTGRGYRMRNTDVALCGAVVGGSRWDGRGELRIEAEVTLDGGPQWPGVALGHFGGNRRARIVCDRGDHGERRFLAGEYREDPYGRRDRPDAPVGRTTLLLVATDRTATHGVTMVSCLVDGTYVGRVGVPSSGRGSHAERPLEGTQAAAFLQRRRVEPATATFERLRVERTPPR